MTAEFSCTIFNKKGIARYTNKAAYLGKCPGLKAKIKDIEDFLT